MKIVILSFNHPDITARAVESSRAQVSDVDILLVHNGSLPVHRERLILQFPKIQHLVLEINQGFAGGANAGLREAFRQNEWALFLTNDCQLRQWQIPRNGPALVAPLIWSRQEGRVDSLGGEFCPEKALLKHCKTAAHFLKARRAYVPGTAFWLHRTVFESVKGIDESFEMYWEDVDFSQRVVELGFPLQIDENTRVVHAIGKTCHKVSRYTTYLFQRNRKRVSLKYARSKWLVLWHLMLSWLQIAWRLTKRRQWDRLKLLQEAIFESARPQPLKRPPLDL